MRSEALQSLFKRFKGNEPATSSSSPGTKPQWVEDRYGLDIVYEPALSSPSGDANTVNIIFVHGLDGGARRTWTDPESNCFWPAWLLEEKGFKSTRIVMYGYDARYTFVVARNRRALGITDAANQLLDELDLFYSRFGDVSCYLYSYCRLLQYLLPTVPAELLSKR